MMQLPKDYDSIFRYIVVVSQRAEQLINGARPRTDSVFLKKTLQAKADVDQGEVAWRILTQEELDAQRQAIVDQFRAEVSSDEARPERRDIPDVLPTAAAAVARPAAATPAEDDHVDERDDELSRLQRLLGMVGGSPAGEDGDDSVEGAGDDDLEASDDDFETDDDTGDDSDDGDDEKLIDLDDSDDDDD